MIIVIGITALISASLLVINSRSRDGLILSADQAKISQTILRAKSLSLSSYAIQGSGSFPIFCGYGVHFVPAAGTYGIFTYNAQKKKDCASITSINTGGSGQYAAQSTFTLDPGIAMVGGAGALTDVFFLPPDPLTMIWNGNSGATSSQGTVTLSANTTPPQALTVSVSEAGQINP